VVGRADLGFHGRERVPAEHRVLGLDRRSFGPALFVIAVFVLAALVIPGINSASGYDDPVVAGQRMALAENVVFTPAVGWEVEEGHRVGADGTINGVGEVELTGDGVTFVITPGTFTGSPSALLKQVTTVRNSTSDPSFQAAGSAVTVTTDSGETGVAQAYRSINGDGVLAAFVIGGTGLKITAYGQTSQMVAASAVLTAMVASITSVNSGGSPS
jgi:hypothetical protein